MHTTLLLEMAADALPDRIAFGGREDGLTFSDLRAASLAVACAYRGEGGALVYIGLSGPQVPILIFASACLAVPFTPINYRLTDAELQKLVSRTAPSTVVIDDDMVHRLSPMDGINIVKTSELLVAAQENKGAEPLDGPEPDIAIRLFTSGTTGEPKAALLRHRHLTSYILNSLEFAAAEDGEAALVTVPPYHIAGISAVLSGVYAGRRTVYLPTFSAEAWVEIAESQRISQAMVVPTMLGPILDVIERRGIDLPHLKSIAYGGGRMPLPTVERALKLLPQVSFANAYGLTETSSTIAVLTPDDHRQAFGSANAAVKARLGSVGQAMPGVQIEIRDEHGKAVSVGTKGEIYVFGDQVAGEYSSHKAISDDGWFATNDSGWLDEEGYLFVEGRLDDVIVRGAENISPGEIEDLLRSHPGVSDVAVIGLPDEKWGEKIAAVIVPHGIHPDRDELAHWVRSRLRSTKTPESWFFRDTLPYNDTGKLLRRALRKELAS